MRRIGRLWLMITLLGVLWSGMAQASGRGVVLNFNEVDISTMVKFISDLTGRNFILDDRVKGKISVYSPAKLSTEDAYNVFVSVLELKGFTVVQSGKVAKIVPAAGVRQSGVAVFSADSKLPVNESYVAQVIELENISSQEALPFLQPMVSKDGHLSAFGSANLLLVVDSALNIRKLHEILKMVDTERTRDGVEIIYLKNASADSVTTTVRQWLSGGSRQATGQAAQPASTSSQGSVMADTRLNALIVFGNDSIKSAVREMVQKLDVAAPESGGKVNVYYLEHADATELAKVLDGVVKGISAAAATGQAQGTATAPAAQSSPFESGKITITPDKATNSLVIMASPNDYNNLLQVIKKLDRRSRQVFVEVLIAEVSLDKARNLGMQAGLLGGYVSSKFSVGGYYDPFGSFTNLLTLLGSSALSNNTNLQLQSPANVAAVLQALDSNDLLNVLSTPNILTSDNKEAEIFVGENVPFQGSSTISTTGTTTSVERKDTGITLKIKPQISEGDYVRMDINQEISAVKASKGQAVDLVTTKRSAKTSIVVKDREMVVIGGLIQDREEDVVSKVPFLGDIPLLGWAFKTTTKERKKTNLLILLTPKIIKDATDLADVSQQQRTLFGDSARKVSPVDVKQEISGK